MRGMATMGESAGPRPAITVGSRWFGTWLKLGSPEIVDILAAVGFDFVVVDLEHSPLSVETAARLIAFAQGRGMSALVRVSGSDEGLIQVMLDAGADGVLVPRIADVAGARQLLAAATFPPAGR